MMEPNCHCCGAVGPYLWPGLCYRCQYIGLRWAAKMARIPPHDNPYNPKPESCDCPTCAVKAVPEKPKHECPRCGSPAFRPHHMDDAGFAWVQCVGCLSIRNAGKPPQPEPAKPLPELPHCPTCTCAAFNHQVETLAQMMQTMMEMKGRKA